MSRIFARDAALSTGLRFGQLAGPQRRLVSLFDLMEYFPLGPFAEEFLRTRVMLGGIAAPETSQEVREANAADLRGRMANLRDFLARFGFVASHHNSVLMVAAVNMPNVDQNWALQAAKRLEEMELAVIADLKSNHFFHILPGERDFYEREMPAGKEVASAFPAASVELREAGSCYALGRYTASVFFSMRAMTLALQAIAEQLRVQKKVRLFEPDGTILNHIEGKIKKRLQKLAPEKKKKTKAREYFENLSELSLRMLRAKDAWRNSVAHARRTYDPTEAVRVLVAVQDMLDLAVKLGHKESPPGP